MLLDMMAALLSGGRATHEIPADPERETGLSQVFIAVDPSRFAGVDTSRIADSVIDSLQARYPGERTLATRARSVTEGIPVDPSAWQFAQTCAGARTLSRRHEDPGKIMKSLPQKKLRGLPCSCVEHVVSAPRARCRPS